MRLSFIQTVVAAVGASLCFAMSASAQNLDIAGVTQAIQGEWVSRFDGMNTRVDVRGSDAYVTNVDPAERLTRNLRVGEIRFHIVGIKEIHTSGSQVSYTLDAICYSRGQGVERVDSGPCTQIYATGWRGAGSFTYDSLGGDFFRADVKRRLGFR